MIVEFWNIYLSFLMMPFLCDEISPLTLTLPCSNLCLRRLASLLRVMYS